LTAANSEAGYGHRLSLWQVEVSLTQVFNRPVQGRHFFEEVIRENIDLGRPSRVTLLFPTRTTSRTPPPPHGYRTRVLTTGVNPSLHVEYKRSHVKQYFKENRALRTETTINNPGDFQVKKGVENLPSLRQIGDEVNHKLLELERVGQNCALSQDELDRLQKPSVEKGQRAPGLRFGDVRVQALLQTLCLFVLRPGLFRNADLRENVAALLGLSLEEYAPNKMTYDLRRLCLKGLIRRIPRSHRYVVTSYGLKVALFYAKVYLRIVRPGWASIGEPADDIPRPLRSALEQVDIEIARICDEAKIAA
jgi:hypothetical protein